VGLASTPQLITALPRFVAAQTRQTVTAANGQLEWIKEYLLPDQSQGAAQRDAFLAAIASIYRPRLQQLGDTVREGESDDERLLRSSLLDFFAVTLEDAAVREMLARRGRTVLGLDSDGKLHPDAIPKDVRGLALRMAVVQGGKAAFEAAESHLRATQDAQLRSHLLVAMGSTANPDLVQRARALVLTQGAQSQYREQRPQLRDWLETHFEYLESKLAPAGAQLVSLYAAGMCSAGEAAQLEAKFAERVKNIEGGPLQLRQLAESIALCAAAKAHHAGDSLQVAAQ
jgi:cytosol alanyl aminopeptidase